MANPEMDNYVNPNKHLAVGGVTPTDEQIREALQTLHGNHMSHERLVCFLYLLMRDELPTGTVCRIIQEFTECSDPTGFEFSNPHLETLARDYADRIREG